MEVIQFNDGDLDKGDWEGAQWTFTAAMIVTCSPLFDDCEDNYEVAEKLKKAKVIGKNDEDDTESCQMFIYFKDKSAGKRFLNRLNKYLKTKAQKLEEAKSF